MKTDNGTDQRAQKQTHKYSQLHLTQEQRHPLEKAQTAYQQMMLELLTPTGKHKQPDTPTSTTHNWLQT